jgi:hypothetical protein
VSLTVFGPRIASEPTAGDGSAAKARERPRLGPGHERNGTRGDRTRAPQKRRAWESRRPPERRRREWRGASTKRRILPEPAGPEACQSDTGARPRTLKRVGDRQPHRRRRSGAGRPPPVGTARPGRCDAQPLASRPRSACRRGGFNAPDTMLGGRILLFLAFARVLCALRDADDPHGDDVIARQLDWGRRRRRRTSGPPCGDPSLRQIPPQGLHGNSPASPRLHTQRMRRIRRLCRGVAIAATARPRDP